MQQPTYSPWGFIQESDLLCPGVYSVSTASHGGIMLEKEIAATAFSEQARRIGIPEGNYLCYEEDADAYVALRELMDHHIYSAPVNKYYAPGEYEPMVNRNLQILHKEYWQARQKRMAKTILPEQCYSCLATTGEIVILKRGEMGYFKTDIPVSDRDAAKELVKHYNDKLGVTKPQYEAMKVGSMFGWDTPAANPQSYDQEGVATKPKKKERGDAR